MGYTGDSFKKEYDKKGNLIDPEDRMIDKTLNGPDYYGQPKSYFQALCHTASQQRWCWQLKCTTCHCMYIRAGFYLIAKKEEFTLLSVLNLIKNPNINFSKLSFSEMENVIIDASKADLNMIKYCKFPDWLGYIGLLYALFNYDETSHAIRKLTKSYCTQFQKMLDKKSKSFIWIDRIIQSDYKETFPLSLLESIEKDLSKSNFK